MDVEARRRRWWWWWHYHQLASCGQERWRMLVAGRLLPPVPALASQGAGNVLLSYSRLLHSQRANLCLFSRCHQVALARLLSPTLASLLAHCSLERAASSCLRAQITARCHCRPHLLESSVHSFDWGWQQQQEHQQQRWQWQWQDH